MIKTIRGRKFGQGPEEVPAPSGSRETSRSRRGSPSPSPNPNAVNPLSFYMDGKMISATKAERLDPRRHVYRLTKTLSLLDHVRCFLSLCPWFQAIQPDWFLPQTVILKKQKPGWEEQFAAEIRAYKVLESVQGTVVPYFYGTAIYDNSPAIVLSEVRGKRFYELAATSEANNETLAENVYKAFKALHDHNIIHGDSELHNIFKADAGVMLVDFELAWFGEDNKPWEESINKADATGVICELRGTEDE